MTVMCILAGIINITAKETVTVTTVILSDDVENGLMKFSEEYMNASTARQDRCHMVQTDEDRYIGQIENYGSNLGI